MPGREAVGYAVEVGDVLQLQGWSRVQSTIRASVRIRPASGGKPFAIPLEVTVTGNRATTTVTKTIDSPGVIDNVQIENTPKAGDSAIGMRGELYAQLMMRGAGCISCGYVYPGHTPSLLDLVEPGPAGGQGWRRVVALGDPAANVDYTLQTVPVGAIWRVRSSGFPLTTDVNAANRRLRILHDDGANPLGEWEDVECQTASLSGVVHVLVPGSISLEGNAQFNSQVVTHMQGPDPLLYAGDRLTFTTGGLQATDNWGAGFLLVEEWVVPN